MACFDLYCIAGRNHRFLVALRAGYTNHLEEIATLESVSRYSWEQCSTCGMCIPSIPVIRIPKFSKEPGTIEQRILVTSLAEGTHIMDDRVIV